MKTFLQPIYDLWPCTEGKEWLETQSSLQEAWENCPRPEWLLWLANRVKVDRKLITLAACSSARITLKYLQEDDLRLFTAIDDVESWCCGNDAIIPESIKEACFKISCEYALQSVRNTNGSSPLDFVSARKALRSSLCAGLVANLPSCNNTLHDLPESIHLEQCAVTRSIIPFDVIAFLLEKLT